MLGSIIGGAIGAIGGFLNQSSANKAAEKAAKKQREWEKQILQNQVSWRVADALRSGLHPLAALGLNPASSSASQQVFGDSSFISQAGSDIGRGIDAALESKDRMAAQLVRQQVERGNLENEFIKAQVASQRMRNVQQSAPGLPGPVPLGIENIGREHPIAGTSLKFPTTNRDAAQNAENDYGEILGEVQGLSNFAVDAYKYLQLEPILTGAGDILTGGWDTPAGRAVLNRVGGWASQYSDHVKKNDPLIKRLKFEYKGYRR